MKTLNKILGIAVYTMIIVSFIEIIFLNYELIVNPDLKFSLSGKALQFYISQYGNYKTLFTLCIASLAAYSALNSLKESIKANSERVRQDRFTEWKYALELRILDIETKNPEIKRFFTEQRFLHFLVLYKFEFEIKNKAQLQEVFAIYSKFINTIETQNNVHIGMGGAYRDNEHSYSFQAFKHLLFSGLYDHYDTAELDLKQFYLSMMDKGRYIDSKMHEEAQKNFRKLM